MSLDGLDGFADGGFGVSEAFEPVIEIDAAFADSVERFVLDAARFHDMVEMRITHVTGAALGMGDHHDLFYAEFIDGNYQAAHGGVEGRDDESAGIFDDLGIAVLETECSGEKFGQTRVHTGEYRQFFVGVLVSDVLLVAFLRYERLIELKDLVYHNRMFIETYLFVRLPCRGRSSGRVPPSRHSVVGSVRSNGSFSDGARDAVQAVRPADV